MEPCRKGEGGGFGDGGTGMGGKDLRDIIARTTALE